MTDFKCVVSYLMTCSICGEEDKRTWPVYPYSKVPYPSPPDGWVVFDGGLVCTKHEIRRMVRKNGTVEIRIIKVEGKV
jgi:hypothetical protein